MTQPCAKSKAVEGKKAPTLVAKSKDYSIYSQVLETPNKHHKKRLKTGAPLQRPSSEVM